MSPLRCVPKVTELLSPRAEPPSHVLDLSDADLDTSAHSPPVMVLDASQVDNSPHTREVDVVIAFEDSPARIVCHSPRNPKDHSRTPRSGLLNKNYNNSHNSPSVAVSQNDNNVPHWSITADTVPKVGSSASKSKPVKNLFPSSDQDQANNLSNYEKPSSSNIINLIQDQSHISQHSRGIIQEILAQEMGSTNVTRISLNSQGSPHLSGFQVSPPSTAPGRSPRIPKTSSPTSSSQKIYPNTSETHSTNYPAKLSSSRSRVKGKLDISKYPQPRFDEDSDVSVDKIPVRERKKGVPTAKTDTDNSESDSCSLHEYVTPKKSSSVSGTVKTKTLSRAQSSLMQMPTKKVLLRHKQSVPNLGLPNFSKLNQSTTSSKSDSKNQSLLSTSRTVKNIVKQEKSGLSRSGSIRGKYNKTKAVNSKEAKSSENNMIKKLPEGYPRSSSPQTLLQESILSSKSSCKTSTPTYGTQPSLSQSIDASAIHSESTLSVNISTLHSTDEGKMSVRL